MVYLQRKGKYLNIFMQHIIKENYRGNSITKKILLEGMFIGKGTVRQGCFVLWLKPQTLDQLFKWSVSYGIS